jgi:chlorophyll/bacteriochlorophyll a synthase
VCTGGRQLCVSAAAEKQTTTSKEAAVPADVAPTDGSAAARQMLGMKGAAMETDIWKIRVQLTKPVTWVPLIWGACLCGTRALQGLDWLDISCAETIPGSALPAS